MLKPHRVLRDRALTRGRFVEEDVMDLGLKGKVVIVTGGSEGIGGATSRLFAEEGANVVVNYFVDSNRILRKSSPTLTA